MRGTHFEFDVADAEDVLERACFAQQMVRMDDGRSVPFCSVSLVVV